MHNVTWHSTVRNGAYINIIFRLQKKTIRVFNNLGDRCSLREQFQVINIMRIAGRYLHENVTYSVSKDNSLKRSDIYSLNNYNKNKLAAP